jgi:hypothetical protein
MLCFGMNITVKFDKIVIRREKGDEGERVKG